MPQPRKRFERWETWLLVTVISALIWLYAEGANVQQVTRPVRIAFTAPSGEDYAISPADEIRADVTFRGSSSQIQRFEDLADNPIRVVISPDDETVTQRTIILRDELNSADLGRLGIIITEVDPATQTVVARELVSVPLRVQTEAGRYELSENPPPRPTPAEVLVTVPADVARQIRSSYVAAELYKVIPSETAPGLDQVQHDVPLRFPADIDLDDPWTKVSDRSVTVDYSLEKLEETHVIDRVPLFVNLPISVQQHYVIRPTNDQNFLNEVEIRGPAEIIERIRANDPQYPVRAEIREANPTLIEQTTTMQPIIVAPPGVTATEAPKLIPVTIERRRVP